MSSDDKRAIRSEPKALKAGTRPKSVTAKFLFTADGLKTRVLAVDANSPSFGADFLYVFTQNVRRARKENKLRLGSTDGVNKGG